MGFRRRERAHSRTFRVLRAAVVAVVSLWLVYLVGIDVFLSTSPITCGPRISRTSSPTTCARSGSIADTGVLVGLSSMDHLSASERVTADADGVFLDELDARGGGMRAHGSYASDHDVRRGAFIVEKGPFGVGIRLDPDVGVRFGGLRGWLEGERRIVEKVRVDRGDARKAKRVR